MATLSHIIYLFHASFCRIIYNYFDVLYRCPGHICTGRYIINSDISIGLVIQQVTITVTICSILLARKIKV